MYWRKPETKIVNLPTTKQIHGDFMKSARQRHAQRCQVLGILKVQIRPSASSCADFLEFIDDCRDDVNVPLGDREVEGGVAPDDGLGNSSSFITGMFLTSRIQQLSSLPFSTGLHINELGKILNFVAWRVHALP